MQLLFLFFKWLGPGPNQPHSGGGGGGVLKVTSPKDGDVLEIGKRYTIKWDKGAGSRVKIELVNHDDIYLWDEPKITKSTPNDGKFT